MLKKILPYLFITAGIIFIALTNTKPQTYLMGWDNLLPELDSPMNIFRSFFAVWQEYQGLGLVGGMGYAADLPHQLFIALSSLIIPQTFLRYLYTYLMLWTGCIGMYVFLRRWVIPHFTLTPFQQSAFPLLGSIFYLCNLATVQMFFTPYETFSTHFGFLPWIVWAVLYCFVYGSRKYYGLLAIILLLATPQNYVPTIFLVTLLTISIFLGTLFCFYHSHEIAKRIVAIFIVLFGVNAFWLFPFAYFILTHSSVIFNAKLNQMVTPTVFEQNRAFGYVPDFMLLKGFWFDNLDPNLKGQFTYMLSPWRDYLAQWWIQGIGFVFFGSIGLGIFTAMKKRQPLFMALLILFGICATALVTEVFPFSLLNFLIRSFVPVINQAFRFPFTKFSLLTTFCFASLFTIGLITLAKNWKSYKLTILKYIRFSFKKWSFPFKKRKMHSVKPIPYLGYYLLPILFLIYVLPIFQGHLFYEKEHLTLPQEYQQLFTFFQSQPTTDRVAILPQYTFWGWDFTKWGYGGSGFIWHGIQQPILENAFAVWSREDENYYWELSRAVDSRDAQAFEKLLQKYQIRWIVLDSSLYNPGSISPDYLSQLQSLLGESPFVKKVQRFGGLTLYKIETDTSSPLFVVNNTPSANSYVWGDLDEFYLSHGTYISDTDPQFAYPFRSLFTYKNQTQKEFALTQDKDTMTFSQTLSASTKTITIPSISTTESIIPAKLSLSPSDNVVLLSANAVSPTISVGGQKVWSKDVSYPLFTIPKNVAYPLTLLLNGLVKMTLSSPNQQLPTTFLSMTQDNYVTIQDKNGNAATIIIKASDVRGAFSQPVSVSLSNIYLAPTFSVSIPKITDHYANFEANISKIRVSNCSTLVQGVVSELPIQDNGILLSSTHSDTCLAVSNPTAYTDQAYAVFINESHQNGQNMDFWVEDVKGKMAFSQTYLPDSAQPILSSFIIPPLMTHALGYSFHLENNSVAYTPTSNTIYSLSSYPIPYSFLTQIMSDSGENPHLVTTKNISFDHPNPSLYISTTDVSDMDNPTIVLSQAFDSGWHAYLVSSVTPFSELFPFLFGNELKGHVMVNNWENGWRITTSSNTQSSIVIVFLPQYLEYIGFGLLGILGIFFLLPHAWINGLHRLSLRKKQSSVR